jgi:predicted 2-oxoglutarate/Fe(II)-dependent dioxygenase YbiX
MTRLLPPDRAPFSYGMAPDWRHYSFDWQAGRPAAIILANEVPYQHLQPIIEDFIRHSDGFIGRDADVLILGTENVARDLRSRMSPHSFVQVIDCDSGFLDGCNAQAGKPVVLVVDRNIRVALQWSPDHAMNIAAACLDCLDDFAREGPRDVFLPAPILILQNLLPRALCRTLIERFESGGSVEGKVAMTNAAGMPQSGIDNAIKRRRDLQIRPHDPLYRILQEALLQRCAPEIAKAFQVTVAHTDRILIARYDDSEGWFRRHRDNCADNVAFREFAISVNLNTEEYEGGHLSFPEYNDHRYRPPTGAGIIFSASLLHEALAVSHGCRYVLLTFFHSEAAEARRRAYETQILATHIKDSPAGSPTLDVAGGGE